MIPDAPRNNKRSTSKRIIYLIVGIFAALAAIRVLLEAVFELQYHSLESLRAILRDESIFLVLAAVLLFEAYRFVKYFAKKPPTHDP